MVFWLTELIFQLAVSYAKCFPRREISIVLWDSSGYLVIFPCSVHLLGVRSTIMILKQINKKKTTAKDFHTDYFILIPSLLGYNIGNPAEGGFCIRFQHPRFLPFSGKFTPTSTCSTWVWGLTASSLAPWCWCCCLLLWLWVLPVTLPAGSSLPSRAGNVLRSWTYRHREGTSPELNSLVRPSAPAVMAHMAKVGKKAHSSTSIPWPGAIRFQAHPPGLRDSSGICFYLWENIHCHESLNSWVSSDTMCWEKRLFILTIVSNEP